MYHCVVCQIIDLGPGVYGYISKGTSFLCSFLQESGCMFGQIVVYKSAKQGGYGSPTIVQSTLNVDLASKYWVACYSKYSHISLMEVLACKRLSAVVTTNILHVNRKTTGHFRILSFQQNSPSMMHPFLYIDLSMTNIVPETSGCLTPRRLNPWMTPLRFNMTSSK